MSFNEKGTVDLEAIEEGFKDIQKSLKNEKEKLFYEMEGSYKEGKIELVGASNKNSDEIDKNENNYLGIFKNENAEDIKGGNGHDELNVLENVDALNGRNEKIESSKNQNTEVKIGNLHISNLKKEIQEFVDVSKDMKTANNKMIINIRPIEFGNMEIVFVKNKEFINIQVQVENAHVLKEVEEVVEEIKNSLESREIKVEISVKDKEQESMRDENQDANEQKKKEEKRNDKNEGEKLNQFKELISEMLGEMKND